MCRFIERWRWIHTTTTEEWLTNNHKLLLHCSSFFSLSLLYICMYVILPGYILLSFRVFLLLTSTDSIASSSFSLFPFACVLDYLGWRARGFERVRSGEPRDSSPFPAFVFFLLLFFCFLFFVCVFFPRWRSNWIRANSPPLMFLVFSLYMAMARYILLFCFQFSKCYSN